MTYDVAFIGTGDPDEGFAMAYHHARGYERHEDCDPVACADVVPENGRAFAAEYDLPEDGVFEDHERMLGAVEPDVVSVCVPPALHAPLTIDALRAGAHVHCEKPMADTFGASERMARVADQEDRQLTFGHQRRFAPSWAHAADLLEDGEIGDLRRVETSPPDFFDWGTHAVDLANSYAGEQSAEWVLAGLDDRDREEAFGAPVETDLVAQWQYPDGVHGFAATGAGAGTIDAITRLVGADGVIEVSEGYSLDVIRGGDRETVEFDRNEWTGPVADAVVDVVDAIDEGRPSPLRAGNALRATEILFGAYESTRRRGRVDLPLAIDDNPLGALRAGRTDGDEA